jgi:hypothetical protein
MLIGSKNFSQFYYLKNAKHKSLFLNFTEIQKGRKKFLPEFHWQLISTEIMLKLPTH